MTEELVPQTAEEQAYFDNKGDVPAEKPAEAPVEAEQPAEQPAEPEEQPQPRNPDGKFNQEGRLVPLGALQEERQKRQREREERLKLEGRLQLLERMANEPRAPEPAKELDPLAKLDESHRFVTEQRQREQQETAKRDLVNFYASDAAEFASTTPDFNDAYAYVSEHRMRELQLMGWSPQQAQEILQANELAIAQQARASGKSPAQIVYEMAKHRGYAGKKPEPEPAKVAAADKLETVASGQRAAKSLSQASGGTPRASSLQALLDMDDDEFDKATSGKKWSDIWTKG